MLKTGRFLSQAALLLHSMPAWQVRHRLSVRPSVSPPQRIGDISKSIFQLQVEGLLGDLQAELDSRQALQ